MTHTFPANALAENGVASPQRKAYIHVVQTSGYNPTAANGASIRISGDGEELTLKEGDGAFIHGEAEKELKVENIGDSTAEILLFDVE